MLAGSLALGGCFAFDRGLLDPGEMMRAQTKERLLVPVLPSLAEGMDEAEPEFTSAEDVKQADLVADNTDYVIGRNDLLQISLSEVAGQGIESVKATRVSESGMVSLPLIGSIKASGLTEADLEKAVAQSYRDKNLIQNAQVSVTVLEARQRTFSILGVVGRPGQYQIVQSDFRFLDALTLAGDVTVQGVEYAYIIRKNPPPDAATKPAGQPGGTQPGGTDPLAPKRDPLEAPRSRANTNVKNAIARAPIATRVALLADAPADGPRKVMIDGKWVEVGTTTTATEAQPGGTVPQPGNTGQNPVGGPPAIPAAPTPGATDAAVPATPATPAADTTSTDSARAPGFSGFDAPKADTDTRILRVPLERLQRGELQYNVVIRPNDTIIVPSPKVGEYYMGGHVQRTGVYSLTGRQITLKQAIISAGMIDPLGWPERTEVIRRVGKDKELFVRVDLPKIFAGQQSDIYLRPYDTINVGTNALAPFLAAVRGAFRFTYGFGFIYDRNFYDENNLNQ
jgi:protein involved in polysaccharide export with SLBB domain